MALIRSRIKTVGRGRATWRAVSLYNGGATIIENIIVKSLIIIALIVIIILIVLLVFVPAIIERVSVSNRARREKSINQLRKLERESRRLERLLAPYLRARSAAYHDVATRAFELFDQLQADFKHSADLVSLVRCPQVYGFLLPVQHFFAAPQDVSLIVSDFRQLKRIKADLVGIENLLAEIQLLFDSLSAVPHQVIEKREKVRQRLENIQRTVDQERDAGIEALDDFRRDIATVREMLASAQGDVEALSTLGAIDDAAFALESAESKLSDAEVRAQELQRERAALDHRLRRAATELDNTQAANKAGPAAADLPQIRPLLRRAAALVNESAQDHRRRREFNAAGADVTTAGQLIKIGKDLALANSMVRVLIERDVDMGSNEAVRGLWSDLNNLLDKLPANQSDGQRALADAALASQAAKLHTRAETLTRQQDEVIAGHLRQATAIKDGLERSWNSAQALLRLADDEPLTRRYSRLLQQFEEARLRPSALDEFQRDVAVFQMTLNQWFGRVQSTKALIPTLRSSLPGIIDEALETADEWNCLTEDVTFIQQRAADFETAQAKFASAQHRQDAEVVMDHLANIDKDIAARFAQLKERAGRLNFLESDVNEIVLLATRDLGEPSTEHPERPKWERTRLIIDHHLRSAHAAHHYEDASVALLRAADAANKLAL